MITVSPALMVDGPTSHDYFAGGGGSSTGLKAAGIRGIAALNHWDYAIEMHNANHPEMDHELADVWTADPRRYKPANIAWFSPDCAKHSIARGKARAGEAYKEDLWRNPTADPSEERSRMLMEAVPYISEMAGYLYVIVENVLDVYKWVHFDKWLKMMSNLGYEYKLLSLNSRFFGTPQSRDRFFGVFWKRGCNAPDLNFSPVADCERCGRVESVQSWKNGRSFGKYGPQYIYCCPSCGAEVKPPMVPASSVIDYSLPIQRIGDRDKPLSENTLNKIRYGIERYGQRDLFISYYGRENAAKPTDSPLPTVVTENKIALAMVTGDFTRPSAVAPDYEPLSTVTTHQKKGLALVMGNYKNPVFKDVNAPLGSVLTVNKYSLLLGDAPNLEFLATYNGNPVYSLIDEPAPTVTTVQRHGFVSAPAFLGDLSNYPVEDVLYRMLEPRELSSGTGFPEDYILFGSKKNQVRAIGGAVDPNVAKWIGERIVKALE